METAAGVADWHPPPFPSGTNGGSVPGTTVERERSMSKPNRGMKAPTLAPVHAPPDGVDVPCRFVFRDGRFVRGDPLNLDAAPDGEGLGETLRAAGYELSQVVGGDGLHYELYERSRGGAGGCVVLLWTGFHGCTIVVAAWPDLIALLRDLSVIVLAGERVG